MAKSKTQTEIAKPSVPMGGLSLVPDLAPPKKTGGRNPNYLGPGSDIEPEVLTAYEQSGKWFGERKKDGMWAELIVGCPAEGRPNVLSSRDAATAPISGSNLGDLHEWSLPWPEGTVIAAELEAATQWATEQVAVKGYRSLHMFDLVQIGDRSARQLPWHQRRELLVEMHAMLKCSDDLQARFPLLEASNTGLLKMYEDACADGDEGIVLWNAHGQYMTHRADGKTEQVVRCKRWLTGDYVLWDLGKTPGGALTGQWGLFKGGKLQRVMQSSAPTALLTEANVGKLVCEFKGWAKFKSGALRHASFVRVREPGDKSPQSCTL